ncbi:putative HAD-superfamily hydrolase, subfamily IA [Desulfosarcina variabilis str. Montpellier]|uniref:HAD family hydrolase n=1 Tax=Desulfosarcina variabilis TaxID=2300 RepID=UPI003AFA51CC
MANFDKIVNFLDNLKPAVKVISFDIYNTLLIRLTPPDTVFQISSKYMSDCIRDSFFLDIPANWIYSHKNKFKLRYDRLYFIQEAEWTISMWLKAMAREISVDPEKLIELGKKIEVRAEFENTEAWDGASEVLRMAIDRGFQIIATSDMWLETEEMEALLTRFELHFHRIFSSGSMGVSKRRGTIFRRIQNEMGLPASCFAHIGDNPKADLVRPRLAGWSSLKISNPTAEKYTIFPKINGFYFKKQSLFKEILQILQGPPSSKDLSPFFRTAFDDLAPLLILFSFWQWRKFFDKNLDAVFFIARDARAMFDVYELISNFLPNSPPRFYVRLSRKLLTIAHPEDLLLNVKHLPGKAGKRKIGHWLSNFSLSTDLLSRILKDSGLDENDNFSNKSRNALKGSILRHKAEIEACAQKQKKLIKEYLFQQAGTSSLNRIGLVDSGWACTIQDCLRNTFKDAKLIIGAYLGISAQGSLPTPENQKFGFLRDDFRKFRHMNPLEGSAGVVRLWDTLLREPTGTATILSTENTGEVVPILTETSAIGNVEREAADSIQKGITKGVTKRFKAIKLLSTLLDRFSDTDIELAAATISRRITTCPGFEKASAFLNLEFDEGTENGRTASFGLSGIKEGVAWYPGILSYYRLSFIYPALEIIARLILDKKISRKTEID